MRRSAATGFILDLCEPSRPLRLKALDFAFGPDREPLIPSITYPAHCQFLPLNPDFHPFIVLTVCSAHRLNRIKLLKSAIGCWLLVVGKISDSIRVYQRMALQVLLTAKT